MLAYRKLGNKKISTKKMRTMFLNFIFIFICMHISYQKFFKCGLLSHCKIYLEQWKIESNLLVS